MLSGAKQTNVIKSTKNNIFSYKKIQNKYQQIKIFRQQVWFPVNTHIDFYSYRNLTLITFIFQDIFTFLTTRLKVSNHPYKNWRYII